MVALEITKVFRINPPGTVIVCKKNIFSYNIHCEVNPFESVFFYLQEYQESGRK